MLPNVYIGKRIRINSHRVLESYIGKEGVVVGTYPGQPNVFWVQLDSQERNAIVSLDQLEVIG